MTANYHTHTRWCKHATGEIEEYAARAAVSALTELAITAHVPICGNPDHSRLQWEEFSAYDEELNRVAQKYRGEVRIRKGFECEYNPDLLGSYRRFREDYGYEILILGQHFSLDRSTDYFFVSSPALVAQYADEVCLGLETGLFDFLAHPDVVMCSYARYDENVRTAMERIFKTAARLSVPVEINANGQRYLRGYPCWEMWEDMLPFDPDVLIGSDAHRVDDLLSESVSFCEKKAAEMGFRVLRALPG